MTSATCYFKQHQGTSSNSTKLDTSHISLQQSLHTFHIFQKTLLQNYHFPATTSITVVSPFIPSISHSTQADSFHQNPSNYHHQHQRQRSSPSHHLHDAIPVVSSGDPEEGEKGHAKVSEVGVFAQAVTGVRLGTLCRVAAVRMSRRPWKNRLDMRALMA